MSNNIEELKKKLAIIEEHNYELQLENNLIYDSLEKIEKMLGELQTQTAAEFAVKDAAISESETKFKHTFRILEDWKKNYYSVLGKLHTTEVELSIAKNETEIFRNLLYKAKGLNNV